MKPTEKTQTPWMTKQEVIAYLSQSRKTVERRAVPWTDRKPENGKIRYQTLQAAVGGDKSIPRFYRPDVETNCFQPVPQSRPRR